MLTGGGRCVVSGEGCDGSFSSTDLRDQSNLAAQILSPDVTLWIFVAEEEIFLRLLRF